MKDIDKSEGSYFLLTMRPQILFLCLVFLLLAFTAHGADRFEHDSKELAESLITGDYRWTAIRESWGLYPEKSSEFVSSEWINRLEMTQEFIDQIKEAYEVTSSPLPDSLPTSPTCHVMVDEEILARMVLAGARVTPVDPSTIQGCEVFDTDLHFFFLVNLIIYYKTPDEVEREKAFNYSKAFLHTIIDRNDASTVFMITRQDRNALPSEMQKILTDRGL